MEEQFPISFFTIRYLSECIRKGILSPLDIVKICLSRIRKLNQQLNSFITVVEEQQLYDRADACQKEINKGCYRGPLHGIPYSVKDMIHVKGIQFTAGSKIYSKYISSTTASCIKNLNNAGAIMIGTNNLNEFASGITGKNPFYGDSKNPWDKYRISGGSSSGSAVAVATGMALFSVGTDTGGSIRVPASLCGVTGFKPTYNRISTNGVFPLSPSLDHVGLITRNILDAHIVFYYITKNTSHFKKKRIGLHNIISLKKTLDKKIILGLPKNYFFDNIDNNLKTIFFNFIKRLNSLNIIIIRGVDIKYTDIYEKSWKTVRLAEASYVHKKNLKLFERTYSLQVRKMLLEGNSISAINYINAHKQISKISNYFNNLFENEIDALVVPTTVILAPNLNIDFDGSVYQKSSSKSTIRDILLQNTIVFNSTGLPSLTIPIGFAKINGSLLPVGLQLVSRHGNDNFVLSLGYKLEKLCNIKNSISSIIKTI